MNRARVAAWLVLGGLVLAGAGEAGQSAAFAQPAAGTGSALSTDLPFDFDGPPPPVPPEVITRDEVGRATVRAVPLSEPIRLDGRLDEAVYETVPPATGLIQVEPDAGAPASQNTEFWVTFDRNNIYVSARCWESNPERMVVNELRRDGSSLYSNEYVSVMLDTFYDRQNAVMFTVTPIGGRGDGQLTNERMFNRDLNLIWDVAVGRFDGGWTFELAIPFKSLRYRPGSDQIWGLQLERYNKWKNEATFLTRIPASFGWARGFLQMSYAATLVGLEVPPGSKNLEIKPYVVSDLTSDLAAAPRVSNELGGDVGLDVKYGVTQNLTADLTYNTDFAQVEADEQQINLTRFSLFFPEKREFFLENQGTFAFGGVSAGPFGGGGRDTPILFYSRRVGLNQGRVVPIDAGGRLTGRIGRFSLGVLNIQADDEPVSGTRATNFSVVRLRRDLLRRSSIGVLYTRRSEGGAGLNEAYGVDADFVFLDYLTINSYWAQTRTPDLEGDDTSHRLRLNYAGDRYGVQLERLAVGDDFNPGIGYVRRHDMRRHYGQLRFSPRPPSIEAVRKFSWTASLTHIANGAGRLETRDWNGGFGIEFENSDRFNVSYNNTYEFLPQPFRIASGVTLPDGGYDFETGRMSYNFGRHRPVSANVSVQHGTFYSGHKTTLGVGRGRVNFSPRLSVEPRYSVNWVDLVEGAFTTHLVGSRVTYTMSPKMFVSTLLQYNSGNDSLSTNARLRWEYQPGSELFLVYNEQRDTLVPRFPTLVNRALIVKINRLVRF